MQSKPTLRLRRNSRTQSYILFGGGFSADSIRGSLRAMFCCGSLQLLWICVSTPDEVHIHGKEDEAGHFLIGSVLAILSVRDGAADSGWDYRHRLRRER